MTKIDFKKLKKNNVTKQQGASSKTPKKVYKEVEVKKVGRPSWKDSEVEYSRISFDFPTHLLDKLRMYKLAMNFSDQDLMINEMIGEYFENHKDVFEDFLKEKLEKLSS